jgi:hypothetical protein
MEKKMKTKSVRFQYLKNQEKTEAVFSALLKCSPKPGAGGSSPSTPAILSMG